MAKNKKTKKIEDDESSDAEFERPVIIINKPSGILALFRIVLTIAFIGILLYAGFYGWSYKESLDLMKEAGRLMRTGEFTKSQAYCSKMPINSIKCYSELADRMLRDTGKAPKDLCAAMDIGSLAYWERGIANREFYTEKITQCISAAK